MLFFSMDSNPIVIDNGSGTIKAGYSDDDAPRSIFPAVVGKPMMPGVLVALDQKDIYIGDEAIERKGIVKLVHVIQNGLITEWDDMARVWENIVTKRLNCNPEEQGLLITEPPLNPKENREKIAKIVFENLGAPFLFLGVQTVLSLYAYGGTTGLVIDIGDSMTNVSPIYETFEIPFCTSRLPLGGKDLTLYLQQSLRKSGHNPMVAEEIEWVEWIKENACQLAPDNETAMKETESKELKLPDNNTIVTLGSERYKTPEILFNPEIIGKELNGLHNYVVDSILKCEQEIKKELYKRIILSGGSTLFPSMEDRLERELKKLVTGNTKISISASGERRFSSWIGGSLVASLASFSAMCITKNDYNETGASIINSKRY